MTGDKFIEKYGQLFSWDPRIDLDRIAESIVDTMLSEIAELAIAADYKISAISLGDDGHLQFEHNVYSLPESPARDVLMAILAYANDRVAKRSKRQKETLDRIGEHRRRHREHLIETARSRPFVEKVSCGTGWIPIILDFHIACEKHPDFVFISAREKWGILALDYHVDPSAAQALRALEQEAIDESARTCETCGADGQARLEGWRKTLCDRHALDRRLVLSEAEHERLMAEFSSSQARWRPVLDRHRDDMRRSDELFERFLQEFGDLDTVTRRFWSMNLTRIILARREKTEQALTVLDRVPPHHPVPGDALKDDE